MLAAKDSNPNSTTLKLGRYGWLSFTPDYLQRFLSPKWALAFCCPGPFLQGMLITGLLHFFIPHLERQFDLSSIQSGLVSSAYDMAATVCLIPLATIGGRPGANRPRYMGVGLMIIGTGALVFSSPAFFIGPYNNVVLENLCIEGQVMKNEHPPAQNLGWILFLGNLLHGAGATPIYSIAVTYIDDCFPVHSSSFYIEMERNQSLYANGNALKFEKFSELPMAFRRLFKNLKFIFLTLAACCEGIIFSGMAAFMTKLLLQQFGLGPKKQAIFKAALAIPSSLIGILGGGWVIKFFGMNLQQMLIMIVCLVSISFPCIGAMFIYCNNDDLVGLTSPYKVYVKENLQLRFECNQHCDCDESFFFPVCGNDNLTYFSGCHAGCLKREVKNGVDMFYDCKCIMIKRNSEPDAVEGFCLKECSALIIFIILVFTYQTLSFFCIIPTITATLRVVHADVRSLGIALQWVIGRMLGTIPGPLLFGKAIDDSCGYWQKNSDGSVGNCLHYDHLTLGRNLALVMFSSKGLQITFFAIALQLAIKTQRERMAEEPGLVRSTMW